MIIRPKNISDSQWNQALNLYNTAKEKGDRYPELTVAQAALETGWFKSTSGKYNYFGQKASKGQQGTVLTTTEMAGNKAYTTQSKFRDYNNLGEAVDDRLKKWGSKYTTANTIDEAISKIWQYDPKTGQGKGYATDVNYGNKLKSILGSMGITSTQSNEHIPQATPENKERFISQFDFNAPKVSGTVFTGEETEQKETEKEGISAAKELTEESFKRDYQDMQAQQAYYQQPQSQAQPQQEIMPQYVEAVQYNPIEAPQFSFQDGGIVQDNIPVSSRGMYEYPNQEVIVPTDGNITMENINHPILGISLETGEKKLMFPKMNYFFNNTKTVHEIPLK